MVTEIRCGVREEARVHHRDGRDPEVPLDQIGGYISEKEIVGEAKSAIRLVFGACENLPAGAFQN